MSTHTTDEVTVSTDVSLIGIGPMGAALARTLLAEGKRVTVFNRTAEKAKALEKEGAVVGESVEAAIMASTLVVVCLADYATARRLLEPAATRENFERRVIVHLSTGTPCAIKIDVEGSECSVVHGARHTIAHAGDLLVAFEAHPKVAARTRQDPVEVMRALLATGREFSFEVDTDPVMTVTADRPFFQQLAPNRVYNVIARSILD